MSSDSKPVDSHACDPSAAPAVSVESLSFSYPGAVKVIDGLSLQVEAGSFAIIVGKTGCGKTTFLRLLKPELTPAGERLGTVAVLGTSVEDLSMRESASSIGFVFQDAASQLVCDVVWRELAFSLENTGMPLQLMRRRVAEVAQFFGIEDLLERSTSSLSAGQQQLVNLASVMALKPALMLLDEPTAQLDPIARSNFCHALFRVNRELGVTVLCSTHAPEGMVAYADAAFELSSGKAHRVDVGEFSRPVDTMLSIDELRRQFWDAFAVDEGGFPRAEQTKSSSAFNIRNVGFRYAKDGPDILRGIDLEVSQGSVLALVGANGCGKTTLLKLVAGLLKQTQGKIENSLSTCTAYIPQDPQMLFLSDSVADELRISQESCGYSDCDIDEMAARLNLASLMDRHPLDLSFGLMQSLALAKVLLCRPSLILCDEPTRGMDARQRLETARLLAERRLQGATIVVATHDLVFAALAADQVALLFDGQIACKQDAPGFFDDNLFYRLPFDGLARLA